MSRLGPLRVRVIRDEVGWCAQGLEIDYMAGGWTPGEAIGAFWDGLTRKVHERRAGKPESFHVVDTFEPAQLATWRALFESVRVGSNVTLGPIDGLPFDEVRFYLDDAR